MLGHMLLKHVVCTVPTETQAAFFAGQLAWTSLRSVPGFVAQFGGYANGEAHILGLWSTHETYRRFMLEQHDRIAEHTGQSGSYSRIAVVLYEQSSPPVTPKAISSALVEAKYLKADTCLLDVPLAGPSTHGRNLLSLVGRRLRPEGRSESTLGLERAEFNLRVRGRQLELGEVGDQSVAPQQESERWVNIIPAWNVTNAP